jgi:uncharacterized membrane protein YcaP (DUF421 family)
MLGFETPPWTIIVRSLVVYLSILVGLRLMGKRELGQMTVFDLVVILLIANAVQNAMVGPDTSLPAGVLSAFVIFGANKLVGVLRMRSGWWGGLVGGTPTVLVENGQFIMPNLQKEGLQGSEVEMAMREHGIAGITEVQLAVLETDGSISIIPNDSKVVRTRRHIRQFRH